MELDRRRILKNLQNKSLTGCRNGSAYVWLHAAGARGLASPSKGTQAKLATVLRIGLKALMVPSKGGEVPQKSGDEAIAVKLAAHLAHDRHAFAIRSLAERENVLRLGGSGPLRSATVKKTPLSLFPRSVAPVETIVISTTVRRPYSTIPTK